MLTADLSNASLWEPIYDAMVIAVTAGVKVGNYIPIPKVIVPVQFDSPVIAVTATSQQNPNRKFAGFVNQLIATGVTVGGVNDGRIDSRRLYFNTVNVYFFDVPTSSYSLEVAIPFWIQDESLGFYQFTGTVNS